MNRNKLKMGEFKSAIENFFYIFSKFFLKHSNLKIFRVENGLEAIS
jgi:hypothetical protein